MPTVTFKITDSQEKLEKVFHFLAENHVHYQAEEDMGKLLTQKEPLLKRYRE